MQLYKYKNLFANIISKLTCKEIWEQLTIINKKLTIDLHAGRAVIQETSVIVISIPMNAVHLRLDDGLVVAVGQLDLCLGSVMWIRAGPSGLHVLLRHKLRPMMPILHRTVLRLVILVQGHLMLVIVLFQIGRAIILVGERRIIYTIVRHLVICLAENCWALRWSRSPGIDSHASRFCKIEKFQGIRMPLKDENSRVQQILDHLYFILDKNLHCQRYIVNISTLQNDSKFVFTS